MATCNTKRSEAIQGYLKGIKDKAYIVIFDLLDEHEDTAFYQVHYNDRTRGAMDYKQWTVSKDKNDELFNVSAQELVRSFVHVILDQLMQDLGENEVVVRRVTVEADGSME